MQLFAAAVALFAVFLANADLAAGADFPIAEVESAPTSYMFSPMVMKRKYIKEFCNEADSDPAVLEESDMVGIKLLMKGHGISKVYIGKNLSRGDRNRVLLVIDEETGDLYAAETSGNTPLPVLCQVNSRHNAPRKASERKHHSSRSGRRASRTVEREEEASDLKGRPIAKARGQEARRKLSKFGF